ncbi:hypothetical protein [Oryzibacter oryziterrae]|uniref:hypothetical protein n=1 Tax=Oryzibacter oryziterrae TaxID=2766474 RepID=UPI001F272653|nr:hypothetical protein [Oryzibacter oryziterrae]
MNWWFLSASVLTVGLTGVHVFFGGPEIDVPIQATGLDPRVLAVAAVVWHGVTVVMLINALLLAAAALSADWRMAAAGAAFQFLAYAGLFLTYNLSRFGSLWTLPQWIAFVAIALIIGAGFRMTAQAAGS